MRMPPTTETEYWNRILELTEATGGRYTVEQVRDAMGLTDEDMAEVENRVYRHFKRQSTDLNVPLEALHDTIHVWEAANFSRMNEEKRTPGTDSARPEALFNAQLSLISATRADRDGDIAAKERVYRLYGILNKALRNAAQRERAHG
jgi:hypothetical protein